MAGACVVLSGCSCLSARAVLSARIHTRLPAPQLELRVTLVRVGSYALAGGAITPRSIAPACNDNPERGALRRISNAVTSEWVSHAEFERAQRAEAEARLAELVAAHAQLRTWASCKVRRGTERFIGQRASGN